MKKITILYWLEDIRMIHISISCYLIVNGNPCISSCGILMCIIISAPLDNLY
jgi:hypothetical protein